MRSSEPYSPSTRIAEAFAPCFLLSALFFLLIPSHRLAGQELPSDSAISQKEGTLKSYLRSAAKEDPGLVAAFKEYHEALQRVPQVSALPDPELAFSYFISPVETRVGPQRARFSVSQMFPWFGTLDRKEEAAALDAKAKYHAFRAKRAKLYEKVRHTWYELYYKKAHIRSVDSTLETLRTMESISESRYRTGQRSMADHLRIRMQRREMEEKKEALEDDVRPLEVRFNNLTGRDADAALQGPKRLVRERSPIDEREQLEDSVLSRDPKLEQLRKKEEASIRQQEVAERKGRPSIGVGLNYTVVGERTDADPPDNGKDILMPMLRLQLPIYRKKYRAMEKEAAYRSERFDLSQAERKEEIADRTESIYTDLEDAERRIELYEKQLDDARRARNILMESFRTGEGDVDELLKLQRRLYRYRADLERARTDRNKSVASLKRLLAR
jgi:cobalt-zinc-cadmium efflux system outer membrane protein